MAFLVLVASCGTGREGSNDGRLEREVLVSAAASLTDVFGALEREFELANPGVDVLINIGGSALLREQILEGAPVDVYASADRQNMEKIVAAAGTLGTPDLFATNTLAIAVAPGNPEGVVGAADLARDGLAVGLCSEGVPCGDLARVVLDRVGTIPVPDTREPNVRALLAKIVSGELDVGIVYATDIAAADGAVDGVEIPRELNVTGENLIVVLRDAPHPDAARAFVAFVLSAEARSILDGFGFGRP